MSTKGTIVKDLIAHLNLIDGSLHEVAGCPFSPYQYKNNLFGNATDQFMFLENINDFPTVSFFQSSAESRHPQGTGEVYGTATFLARCYFMASENEEQADDFIEDLQYSINSFKYTQTNSDLVDLRIQAVSSDEKMLDPYGIVEVSLVLVYRLTI
jgi:hypothetical protein